MANVQVNRNTMSQIADAIRQKLNTSDTYKPSEMANAIESIEEPQQDDFKKSGKIFTTALTSNPFTITAYDQNIGRELLERAFYYNGETNYKNILKNITGITFPAIGLKAPTSMNQFFRALPEIKTIDLVGLDISEVADISNMCNDCKKLTSFKFGTVVNNIVSNINYLFYDCQMLSSIDQGSLDISNIESANFAFSGCISLPGISFINNKTYPDLINTQYMFATCNTLENVILEGINLTTSEDINLSYTFKNCSNLKSVIFKDITIPNSSKIDVYLIFQGSTKLTTITLNNVVIQGKLFNNSTNGYGMSSLTTFNFVNTKFLNDNNDCKYLLGGFTKLDTVNFNGSEFHGSMYNFFYNCTLLTSVNFTNTKLRIYSAYEMFRGCSNLVNIDFEDSLDIETVNTQTLLHMFYDCSSLQSVNFGTGKLICPSASSTAMFYRCYALTAVDFSGVDLRINNAGEMFDTASALTTVLFKEGTIINEAYYMFRGCSSLATIDFSNVQINNAQSLFEGATGLTTVTLKDGNIFDSAYRMFYGCSSLVNPNFNSNTIKHTTQYMFYGCSSLVTVDLSDVTFSDINQVYYSTDSMFYGCTSLQSVVLPASFTKFYTDNLANNKFFYNCTSLQSLTLLSTTPPTSLLSNAIPYLFSNTSGGYNQGMKIYVPQGCSQAYKEDSNWSVFADIIEELS